LSININKKNLMIIKSRQVIYPNFVYDNNILENDLSYKYLKTNLMIIKSRQVIYPNFVYENNILENDLSLAFVTCSIGNIVLREESMEVGKTTLVLRITKKKHVFRFWN